MPCVLVVDDDERVLRMMELLLRSHGYEVMKAENGEVALARMREKKPCLVLLDIQMPLVDGFEFRRRQLADPALATVPVICITALFDPENVRQRLGLPCLAKPADFRAVLFEVEAACGLGRPAEGA